MSMYFCDGCQQFLDDDWHPMEEDELCPDCHLEKDEKKQARAYEISQQHAQWCIEKGLTQ